MSVTCVQKMGGSVGVTVKQRRCCVAFPSLFALRQEPLDGVFETSDHDHGCGRDCRHDVLRLSVSDSGQHKGDLEWVKHVVVIYMENHSFDNLYGLWGSVNGKAVNGLANADVARMTQVNQAGVPYQCRTLKPVSFVK